jgi:hypothetical protein
VMEIMVEVSRFQSRIECQLNCPQMVANVTYHCNGSSLSVFYRRWIDRSQWRGYLHTRSSRDGCIWEISWFIWWFLCEYFAEFLLAGGDETYLLSAYDTGRLKTYLLSINDYRSRQMMAMTISLLAVLHLAQPTPSIWTIIMQPYS